ncbi:MULTISPECIES: hypothetical protein [Maricaulis]|uniref:hypothetical protein n=1 Tax=Maricaulis TaxID=74317 RepID=UPI0025C72C84|nr:hypothetical protein [Maricaulis sp.]
MDELTNALHQLWIRLNEAEHYLQRANREPHKQRQAVFGAFSAMHDFITGLVDTEAGASHFTVDRLLLTALIDIEHGAGTPAFLVPETGGAGAPPSTGLAARIRSAAVAAYTALHMSGHSKSVASEMVAQAFNSRNLGRFLPQTKSGVSARAIKTWANNPRYGKRTRLSMKVIIEQPMDMADAERFLHKTVCYLESDNSFSDTMKKDI